MKCVKKQKLQVKQWGNILLKLYTNGVNKFLKIDDPIALRRDIEEDPIIKDSMADIGALMVLTFGKWLATVINHLSYCKSYPVESLKER